MTLWYLSIVSNTRTHAHVHACTTRTRERAGVHTHTRTRVRARARIHTHIHTILQKKSQHLRYLSANNKTTVAGRHKNHTPYNGVTQHITTATTSLLIQNERLMHWYKPLVGWAVPLLFTFVTSLRYKKVKGTFLYSVTSSLWDCSKSFTLHDLAHLFIPTPFRLLWEAFSHAAITARRLFIQIFISVCS